MSFFTCKRLFTVICYKNSIFCLNVEHISITIFLLFINYFMNLRFIKVFLTIFTLICIIFAIN